ncbi:MAG: carboxypeptidase regulatory-like domain-containing protein [Candidatus Firestonebacteria bacterium]
MKNKLERNKGLTLVELMVGIVMLGLFALGMILAYNLISRGITVTKYKTVANNLAQEKIEKLKDYTYYRLIATPVAALSNPNHSSNPYPPETMTVSGITFTRTTVVRKATENASGVLTDLAPTDPDEGIKKIEMTISWTENNTAKSMTLINLFENPDRTPMDSVVKGRVTDTSSVAVSQVHVFVSDDPNKDGYTDAAGDFLFRVAAGSYTIRADKKQYVSQVSGTLTATSGATVTNDFANYALRTKGTASGYVFKRDHLVISEVCAQVSAGDTNEYIELYNPTSSAVTIDATNFKAYYITSTNIINTLVLTWNQNTVPSHGFFLIGSASAVNGVSCNAYWSISDVFETDQGGAGLSDQLGNWIDKVGWGRPGLAKQAPSNAVEGTGVNLTGSGLSAGSIIERRSYPAATPPDTNGNAFDDDNNDNDFIQHFVLNPQNSSSATENPTGGTPVSGAYVFANDDLSSPIAANSSGFYSLADIAVGSWTLSAAGSSMYGEVTGVTITNGLNTSQNIILTTVATDGYIVGRVTTGASTALAGISMYSDGVFATTDTNGNYILIVPAGTHYVTANYQNGNPNYTCDTTATPIIVTAGNPIIGVDFNLSSGGALSGQITTNGIDALPNIVVIAKDFGNIEKGNTLSNASGNYSITNLPVSGNPYSVFPALDDREVSSPTSMSISVVAGATQTGVNFQVTTALGTVIGTVKDSSNKLIVTGVLVVATTGTISGSPPTVNSTLRGGATVYYSTVSDSNGNYTLPVRGNASGTAYNVYGWYNIGSSTLSATGSTTVTSSASKTVNLSF